MIYSAPIFSILLIAIKCFRHLFLPLSFCVLLLGCDSQSSSTPDGTASAQAAGETTARTVEPEDATTKSPQDDSVHSAENMNDEDEGQSLIAAAKPDDGAHTRRTPMISGTRNDSTLRATLIGNYGGMLPCSFCDNIDLTLNLFADGSVLKTSIYNNPEPPQAPLIEPGIYRQEGNTITIVYENKSIETYRIQDNHLVMMDQDKNPDADYILSRK